MTRANLGVVPAAADDTALFIAPHADGETTVTAAEFDALCDRIASGLAGRGLARGDRIGVLALNRIDYLAVMMGAMRLGIVPVPMNPKFPAATIAYLVADAEIALVIHEDAFADLLAGTDVARLSFEADIAALLGPGGAETVTPEPDETALILYTSGSTGRPKGVRLGHAAQLWVAETRRRDYDLGGDRLLIAAPLYHMNALALAFLVIASGATAVLLPRFESRAYIDAIHRYRCTWLTAVPPMIAMMLRETDALAGADLSSVRTIRLGSAPVSATLEAETHALLPNARILNAYGTTEGGPIVFTTPSDGARMPEGALGRAHPEVDLRLAGPDAPGQGVLQIRSPGQMLGYIDAARTRAAMTADGYYDTGDIFRVDDAGLYHFVSRADDMFVSGGENIFPTEVQAVIDDMAGVLESCVVPVDDAIKGAKPVAFVVPRAGATLSAEDVKAHVLANAPAYQHPRQVWFLDRLPLSATSKVDRTALRRRAEDLIASTGAEAT